MHSYNSWKSLNNSVADEHQANYYIGDFENYEDGLDHIETSLAKQEFSQRHGYHNQVWGPPPPIGKPKQDGFFIQRPVRVSTQGFVNVAVRFEEMRDFSFVL